jgi:DDE superfamily endonuclease
MMRRALGVRAFFSESERADIEDLACQAPAQVGWEITHWSQRSLAQAAADLEYVESIHQTTVRNVLREADLQPHRFRYWKTAIWDDEAVARALKILWYYERIDSLWQRGEVIICLDEKPNIQVLERAKPTQPMRPGQIERQEFDYIRHGTVNLLAGLVAYNGRMWAECLEKNDGEHFRPAVRRLLHPYGWANRIHLIIDNGSSHISEDTTAFFHDLAPRVHVLFTPVNASWLNQAESLLEAFTERYLLRGNWCSRSRMIQHILDSQVDYNRHFQHPFNWEWSRRDFMYWLNNTPDLIRCRTYASGH